MGNKNYKELPAVLNKLLKKYNLEQAVKQEQIINHWESLVGKQISKNCEPLEVKNGVLIVRAKNNLWRQELAQRQEDLLNLVNGQNKTSLVKKIKII